MLTVATTVTGRDATTVESGEGVWLSGIDRVDASADGLAFDHELGAQDVPPATPVDPLVPAAAAPPHPIDQSIEWELAPDDESMAILIAVTSADALATVVHVPAGTRQVTLPALPTGAVAAEVYGMMPKAIIRTCSLDAALAPAPLCERLAVGRRFRLAYRPPGGTGAGPGRPPPPRWRHAGRR